MFKGKKETAKVNAEENKHTYIAPEIEIEGNFKGNGSIRIEGVVNGNISISSVVIGQEGRVNGIINATNAIVNGKLNGSIFCKSLEIMENGQVNDEIKTEKLKISGKVKGSIASKEEIIIDRTGVVDAVSMESHHIAINGDFRGSIKASKLLELGSTGSVEGQITVKNIKTEPGAKLMGSIHDYTEEIMQVSQELFDKNVTEAFIENTTKH